MPLLATDAYGNFIPGAERLPAGRDARRGRHRRHGRRRRWSKATRRSGQPRATRCAPATPSSTTSRTTPRRSATTTAIRHTPDAALTARRRQRHRHGRRGRRSPTTTSCSTRTTSPATAASTRTSASPPSTTSSTPSTTGWSSTPRTWSCDRPNGDLAFLSEWLLPHGAATFPADRIDARVERRAPVPGRQVRHRDAVPASGVRGVRAQGPAAGRHLLRRRRRCYDTDHRSVDRRRVRAHRLSLRPLDADRDDRPLRSELHVSTRARSA